MPKLKLTNSAVAKLSSPERGKQTLYYDTEQKGLAVRVTAGGSKSFVVDTWKGRSIRVKIGACDYLTVYQAREQAKKLLGEIATGIKPAARKKPEGQSTFGELLAAYVEKLKREGKSSARAIEGSFKLHVTPDLIDRKAAEITPTDVHGILSRMVERASRATSTRCGPTWSRHSTTGTRSAYDPRRGQGAAAFGLESNPAGSRCA